MTTFETLKNQLSDVRQGKLAHERFYPLFWEHASTLGKDQFADLLSQTKEISRDHSQHQAWQSLVELLFTVFNPDVGNVMDKVAAAKYKFELAQDLNGKLAVEILEAMYHKNNGLLNKAQAILQHAFDVLKNNSLYDYLLLVGYYQAGEIHVMLKDYDTALVYYRSILDFPVQKPSIGTRALNAIGSVYLELNNLELAIDYFEQAMKEVKQINNVMLESKIYADVANYYFKIKNPEQSFFYQDKSIAIRKEHQMFNALITNYTDLSTLYICLKQYDEAMRFAKEAEQMAEEMNMKIKLHGIYKVLSEIYELQDNVKEALAYYKKYQLFKDEVLSQENSRKIKQLTMNYQMETMQKEKEIFTLRNVELKNAIEEIEASVRYAKRIQNAILPSDKFIKQHLPDSFVLYKPKDIVAGDFFWVEYKDQSVVFAAADCTGHGVPGAFVSVICSNSLNRNLHEKGILNPGKILDDTRENIIQQFKMSEDTVHDGMDISLCVLKTNPDSNQKELQWSGANNPLWIIRDGKLLEFQPDKQPVGNYEHAKPFTTHTIPLEKEDQLYLFTDGFQDQFGGTKTGGKKFKASRFKELLLSIQQESMDKQHQLLEEAFESWKGKLEQVDDICIIGVKI